MIDLERQWVTASKAANGDAVGALLSDDFVALDSDGTMHSKAEFVARTKKAKWVSFEIGDLKVMVHGDSAVVTGSWAGNGTEWHRQGGQRERAMGRHVGQDGQRQMAVRRISFGAK